MLPRIRSVVEQQSPELVLVAPLELRAAALAALAPMETPLMAEREPVPDQTEVPLLLRHPDLDRFGFLADVPEREPDRSWRRLAWWVAVSAAVALGAAAPVVAQLLVR